MKEVVDRMVQRLSHKSPKALSPEESKYLWKPNKEIQKAFAQLVTRLNGDWQPMDETTAEALSHEAKSEYPQLATNQETDRVLALEQFTALLPKLDKEDPRVLLWQAGQDGRELVYELKNLRAQEETVAKIKEFIRRATVLSKKSYLLSYWAIDNQGVWIRDSLGDHLHHIGHYLDRLRDLASMTECQPETPQTSKAANELLASFAAAREPLAESISNYLEYWQTITLGRTETLELVNIPLQLANDFSTSLLYYGFPSRAIFNETLTIKEFYQIVKPAPLGRVMHNLVHNALVHSGVPQQDLQVLLWVGLSNQNVFRAVVADNGQGFDPDLLDKNSEDIQKALLRGITTGGTGIGLASVKADIEKLGGTVKLAGGRSFDTGKIGAVVILDLPVPLATTPTRARF